MSIFYKIQLNILSSLSKKKILDDILRGIEKENIRMSKNNKLSKFPHPKKLGSALTHPLITTDFSENLRMFYRSENHSHFTCMYQTQQILSQRFS